MTEAEKNAIRSRLVALGVDADSATKWAIDFGEQCVAKGINLQTMLLFALCVEAGCRVGLATELAQEVAELHRQVDEETDRRANEARS